MAGRFVWSCLMFIFSCFLCYPAGLRRTLYPLTEVESSLPSDCNGLGLCVGDAHQM